jgi:small-conductance mechanosensitive channel
VLSNLLAGIQIAMTQPIRVEDQVVVEGETGWIETITSNYVVVRLWDLRRMVVPLSYFIEKPFQNWTYEGAAQIGAVLLRVGYTVSVDSLRQKFEEIVRHSPLWDHKVAKLEVTDVAIDAVEVRALVSARTPSQTWDLRCEVREKLVAFLQAQQFQRAETPNGPPSREITAGDNRAPVPALPPRLDQRTSSPAASDSATR